MTRRGRPSLNIRVDREFLDRLQEAIPSPHGKAGGVSQAIRELLYVLLDEPVPRQYGEKARDERLDYLEELARRFEREGCSVEENGHAMDRVIELLDGERDDGDPVRLLRLRAVLGRLGTVRKTPDQPPEPRVVSSRSRGAARRAERVAALYSATGPSPELSASIGGNAELLWESPFRTVRITVPEFGPLEFSATDGTYRLEGLISDKTIEAGVMDWIERC